jgi:predicted acylesterase/phospholipase RssA/CRP-like cAMP-binding protein
LISNEPLRENILLADLSRLRWTNGLEEAALQEISDAADFLHVGEGEVIHRAGDPPTAVYFVTRGRIWVSIIDVFGKTVMERPLVRGGCFGLFTIAQEEEGSLVDVKATEPTSLLKLSFDELHRLTAKYRQFQMNLYRMAGNQVRNLMNVDRKKDQPAIVGVIHQSSASRPLTCKIVERLVELGETPCVACDDPDWKADVEVPFRSLIENGRVVSAEEAGTHLKAWSELGRLFVDISAQQAPDELARSITASDVVFWCVQPKDAAKAKETLKQLQARVVGWREKICLVWLLDGDQFVSPHEPELTALVERTFKLSFSEPKPNQGKLLQFGLERIIHHLRGIRIGIALGGGAARGMAHLGVLKALEQNGIYVDMIAGTSAGAMTGTLYSYGLDVDYNVQCFKDDLRLPWLFRCLPGGGYWYLLYKYRRGQFDQMLRKYMGDVRLEQLAIPTYTVTVDLVDGGPVVRERQDAVHSILESINLPGLSSPILGEQEALVDGGLVNNIPADVLVAKGCNFVIASSVTAKLEKQFSGISVEKGDSPKRKKPSTLQVLMRGHLVQSSNMNAVGVEPADVVIAPDVTAFDLSEFERTDEMADIGEQTAREMIAAIKQLLSKLDDKLFSA